MIILKITKQDGSLYWTNPFNTRAEGDKWLATEKTRPYWDKTYTCEFTGEDTVFVAPTIESGK